MQEENETHYLDEEFGHTYNPTPVSSGKRFANFIIDRIVIYGCISIVNILLRETGSVIRTTSTIEASIINILYGLFFYIFFMFLMEALMKGKSIGKLITKTRAVNEDGSFINLRTALLRSLCRIVPFEPLSAFGNPSFPWHDTWTKSMVVDD